MGKPNKNSGETKKVEEETGTAHLFCYLVKGVDGALSKDIWLIMSNTTMENVKAHQARCFQVEENRTIIIDKGIPYQGDKRFFTEEEFNKEIRN